MTPMRIVYLHAFPLDGAMWSEQQAEFGGMAPTLYPLGETMTTWANRVLAFAPTGRLVVVGCSMGASCALEMARVAGDRIAALVLVGGKAAVRHEPETRDHYIAQLRADGVGGMWPEIDTPVGERARALGARQSVEDLVTGVRAFHTRPDAAGVLRDFRGKVLIVRGEHDGVGPADRAEQMAASTRGGTSVVIPGAGHYVNLDRPEAFNALLCAL
jgi:pimeloyl-ACP methyl ester carboxylesterase